MSTVAQPHIKEVLSLLSFSRLSPSFQQERCVVNREFWFPLLAGALLGTLGWWEPSRALVFDDSAQDAILLPGDLQPWVPVPFIDASNLPVG
jgi:hypothetical protein